jgi:hypothetical protein
MRFLTAPGRLDKEARQSLDDDPFLLVVELLP